MLLATFAGVSFAAEEEVGGNSLRPSNIEPVVYQGQSFAAQLVPPPARDGVGAQPAAPVIPPAANVPAPDPNVSEIVTPSSTPIGADAPLLDGRLPSEELMAPVVSEGTSDNGTRRNVQPYGGGHPTDWSWGCGGSPYRTGPGLCDNWKVGPRWHITVDGLVMHRDDTDLDGLIQQMVTTGATGTPESDQFGYGPGGRVSFASQVGRCANYDIQVVYEGINEWDSSIVFPLRQGPVNFYTDAPAPPIQPPAPFPQGFEQRNLHYQSNINSIELNWLPYNETAWRMTFGPRFIRVNEQISDTLDQDFQFPLPFPGGDPDEGAFLAMAETDRENIIDMENNLMGFQVGIFHDTIEINNRFAFEGFVNGGVYYNKVKYSNVSVVRTTQFVADDTSTTGFNEQRVDESFARNNDGRDLDEISYHAEASLMGVCRLNKCWALRGGYEMLWINQLHLADSAYLGNPQASTDLFLHGWRFGVECRR